MICLDECGKIIDTDEYIDECDNECGYISEIETINGNIVLYEGIFPYYYRENIKKIYFCELHEDINDVYNKTFYTSDISGKIYDPVNEFIPLENESVHEKIVNKIKESLRKKILELQNDPTLISIQSCVDYVVCDMFDNCYCDIDIGYLYNIINRTCDICIKVGKRYINILLKVNKDDKIEII